MEPAADIREFLTTRRARLTPAEVGLPDFGGRRRVPGLRREEVSLLAGISVEYYVRLERGNATGISESVVDGISRALQLKCAIVQEAIQAEPNVSTSALQRRNWYT